MPEGISKIWSFFKGSFAARPHPDKGAGLTAFKEEWSELPEKDKEELRQGIQNGTLNY